VVAGEELVAVAAAEQEDEAVQVVAQVLEAIRGPTAGPDTDPSRQVSRDPRHAQGQLSEASWSGSPPARLPKAGPGHSRCYP
jgi:hypothetical protein